MTHEEFRHDLGDPPRRNRCAGLDPRGIPTTYRGTRFRSRIEARWAAFFDALKWPWTYEPIDLAGYIPDFLLGFDAAPLLVEVKPENEREALAQHLPRIAASGWPGEALIVGASIWELEVPHPLLGALARPVAAPWGTEWELGEARSFWCISCGAPSVLDAIGSWHCRSCGEPERHIGSMGEGELAELWAGAGNRVQWRSS